MVTKRLMEEEPMEVIKMLTSHLRKRLTKRFYDHNKRCNLQNIILKVV